MIDMNSDPTVQTGVSKCETGWTMIDPTLAVDTAADSVAKSVCARFVESGGTVDNKCDAGQYIEEETGNCIELDCPINSGGFDVNSIANSAIQWVATPRETAWSGTPTRMACDIKSWTNTGSSGDSRTLYCDGGGCNQDPTRLNDVDAKCGYTPGCKAGPGVSDGDEYPLDVQYAPCPLDGTTTLADHNWTITENKYVLANGWDWLDDTGINMKDCSVGCPDSGFRVCTYNPISPGVDGAPTKLDIVPSGGPVIMNPASFNPLSW